jgi:hypothetical protein
MVLTERVQLDVAYHDHVVMLVGEHPLPHGILERDFIAARQEGHGPRDAMRRSDQSRSRRLLAQDLELASNEVLVLDAAAFRVFVHGPRE